MTDQLKNTLIGLFVACAIIIAVSLVMFLDPNVGDGKKVLKVRFANIAGLGVGTRVTCAGKPVGEVAAISEVPNARRLPTDERGKVFLYELQLKVDSSVQFYSTDEIAIRTTGLMGEKSIAIIPNAVGKTSVVSDEIIFANSIDPLENTFNQVSKAAGNLQSTVGHLDGWFLENQKNLADSIKSFDKTMARMTTVLESIHDEKLIASLKESSDLLSANLGLLHNALEDDGLLHKTANLVNNLDQTVTYFNTEGVQTLRYMNQIGRDIATGTGTIGRFINSDDFYLRLSSVMGKTETLMNDINHYGILFQYDKSWQRSRTKRANQLKALDTPGEFRSFFEGEVDTIQTSLGRLSELLDRASNVDTRDKIFQSDEFKLGFGSLYRKVQSLTDSLKLYNEELVQKDQ
ncbi:MAG TPA: MlaD family protein [Chlamydiales bacterium]|nr:MlaD family protein [Chlamydiales bacterium]